MNSMWLLGSLFLIVVLALSRVQGQGLSDEEKAEILYAHNHFRGQVDPIATNMLKMEWDENLEYLAQYKAASCTFQDDQQQSVGVVGFDYVGENDAAVYSAGYNTAVNYTQVIGQQWFTEKRFFSYYSAACRDEDGNVEDNGEFTTCGRYTQLVWARSYAVGCGAFSCQEVEGDDQNQNNNNNNNNNQNQNANIMFLVCTYGPGGNFAGEPPYTTGSKPCESCPYDRSYCNKNLCDYSGASVMAPASVLGLLVVALGVIRSSLP